MASVIGSGFLRERSSTAPTRLVSSPSRYNIAVIRICKVLASLIRIPTRSSTSPTRLVSSPSRYIIAVIRICNVLNYLIRIRIPYEILNSPDKACQLDKLVYYSRDPDLYCCDSSDPDPDSYGILNSPDKACQPAKKVYYSRYPDL
jgi:hypothetical protein